jgi:hypothetical protein
VKRRLRSWLIRRSRTS